MKKKISYKAMVGSHTLASFDGHGKTEELSQDGGVEMTQVNWDEALASSGYVKLETDKRKILVGKNSKLEKVEKFGEEVIEFSMVVVEEDEQPVEKVFNTSSKRLLRKLRPLFENVADEVEVRFSVKKIGDKFDTAYDIEQL